MLSLALNAVLIAALSALSQAQAKGVNPSPKITLDMATSFPSHVSGSVNLTLRCDLNDQNGTTDLQRLMELTICEKKKDKSQPPRKLATMNVFSPTCGVTYVDGVSVKATGELGRRGGYLVVETYVQHEAVDHYVCSGKYLDSNLNPKTIRVFKQNDAVNLFNILVKEKSESERDKETMTKIGDQVDVLTETVFGLKKTVLETERKVSSLQSIMNSLDDVHTCSELRLRGRLTRPRQVITWRDGTKVLCDTWTDGGGWTIFQRRADGKESFSRGWKDYVEGFGRLDSDFWLGLDKLRKAMAEGPQELRVDFIYNNQNYFAHYTPFEILDSSTNYRLKIGRYSGTAGDNLSVGNNMEFSTQDRDNDKASGYHCGKEYLAGWWFNKCTQTNLNGWWGSTTVWRGVLWEQSTTKSNSASLTEMKTRPIFLGK